MLEIFNPASSPQPMDHTLFGWFSGLRISSTVGNIDT